MAEVEEKSLHVGNVWVPLVCSGAPIMGLILNKVILVHNERLQQGILNVQYQAGPAKGSPVATWAWGATGAPARIRIFDSAGQHMHGIPDIQIGPVPWACNGTLTRMTSVDVKSLTRLDLSRATSAQALIDPDSCTPRSCP